MLAAIRTTPNSKKASFDEYKSAITLMLGLDNVGASANASSTSAAPSSAGAAGAQQPATPTSAFAPPTTPGGNMLPRAGLKPGTTDLARDVSRQKFNELLIELHEVVSGTPFGSPYRAVSCRTDLSISAPLQAGEAADDGI